MKGFVRENLLLSLCGRYPCEKYQGPDGFDPFTTHQRRSGTSR